VMCDKEIWLPAEDPDLWKETIGWVGWKTSLFTNLCL
jgi:hypothetical protein